MQMQPSAYLSDGLFIYLSTCINIRLEYSHIPTTCNWLFLALGTDFTTCDDRAGAAADATPLQKSGHKNYSEDIYA